MQLFELDRPIFQEKPHFFIPGRGFDPQTPLPPCALAFRSCLDSELLPPISS